MTARLGMQVIENDALVVLCLRDMNDRMTHHEFKKRAAAMGIQLTRSQCHNMLHRAMGRVSYTSGNHYLWRLTAAGLLYREHVIAVLSSALCSATDPFALTTTTADA